MRKSFDNVVVEEPSKEDMEATLHNVEYAIHNLDFNQAVARIMEMIRDAYMQGQKHKPGICDFCRIPLSSHHLCDGCKDLIHGKEMLYVVNGTWYHSFDCYKNRVIKYGSS